MSILIFVFGFAVGLCAMTLLWFIIDELSHEPYTIDDDTCSWEKIQEMMKNEANEDGPTN